MCVYFSTKNKVMKRMLLKAAALGTFGTFGVGCTGRENDLEMKKLGGWVPLSEKLKEFAFRVEAFENEKNYDGDDFSDNEIHKNEKKKLESEISALKKEEKNEKDLIEKERIMKKRQNLEKELINLEIVIKQTEDKFKNDETFKLYRNLNNKFGKFTKEFSSKILKEEASSENDSDEEKKEENTNDTKGNNNDINKKPKKN